MGLLAHRVSGCAQDAQERFRLDGRGAWGCHWAHKDCMQVSNSHIVSMFGLSSLCCPAKHFCPQSERPHVSFTGLSNVCRFLYGSRRLDHDTISQNEVTHDSKLSVDSVPGYVPGYSLFLVFVISLFCNFRYLCQAIHWQAWAVCTQCARVCAVLSSDIFKDIQLFVLGYVPGYPRTDLSKLSSLDIRAAGTRHKA